MSKENEIVLIYIASFIKRYKFAPSMREIAEDLKKSVSTVHYHVKRLKDMGYVDYENGKERTLRIVCNKS